MNFRRILGPLVLLLGAVVIIWVLYNLFVERLPATRGHDPVWGLVTASAFLFVGYRWTRGRVA